ncbi:2OG-Fe(II) oxygenase family protein [Catenovulum sp. SX2]|uniref:2OG-Fe(II) oxygenase family protein n=1 Tax=Catenovulum sp. SX2 TaxID=3398614 RepID=UPI003F825189
MSPLSPLQLAQQQLNNGKAAAAVVTLQQYLTSNKHDQTAWQLLGYSQQMQQDLPNAIEAFTQALALDGNDQDTVIARANSYLLAGMNAIDAFQHALQLAPNNLHVLRGYIKAIEAQGQIAQAESLLSNFVNKHPAWLAGHKQLTSLRIIQGHDKDYDQNYQQALAKQPNNLALWLDWYKIHIQQKNWPKALDIIQQATEYFPNQAELKIAELVIACENNQAQSAHSLYQQTQTITDVNKDMAWLRFSLKQGDYAAAEKIANTWLGTAAEKLFWPYLSLIWRLTDNPKCHWLDGQPLYLQCQHLDLNERELSQLVPLIRSLHQAKAPYAEQSVRGGTQTDQHLLLRHEPAIQQLKLKIDQAVQKYVAQLPEADPKHPLLKVKKQEYAQEKVIYSGSWSTRLSAQGYNVNHTHPEGWISSALYLSLPDTQALGPAPNGWLQFGEPPSELNLPLAAEQTIEPKVARLVLFPSTMWHGTVPFDDGERLTLAFDVKAPY